MPDSAANDSSHALGSRDRRFRAIFEGRSGKLVGIDQGDSLVAYIPMGAVLAIGSRPETAAKVKDGRAFRLAGTGCLNGRYRDRSICIGGKA